MLKINSSVPKTFSRYARKNTINARHVRAADLFVFTTLGTAVQASRIPFWQLHDVGITAAFATMCIKSMVEMMKTKSLLAPIKKRALNIKKSSVHDV